MIPTFMRLPEIKYTDSKIISNCKFQLSSTRPGPAKTKVQNKKEKINK